MSENLAAEMGMMCAKCAAENGVTQSTASQTVAGLEERLGVMLIDRSQRPWKLTAEGKAFYDGCRESIQNVTGPSLIKATCMEAPNSPSFTRIPISRSKVLKSSQELLAKTGGAA